MTPQEQQLLEDFLQRLAAVGSVAKDPQADALIRQRLADQPDALYLLVQRSILQQHALDNAKAQIQQLQAQLGQGGGSFLGGQGQQASWGQGQPVYGQQPGYGQQAYSQPPPVPAPAPSWRERLFGGAAPAPTPAAQPSFLSSAARTAAGVAGGMFLFEGIEDLVGGHHGGGMFGGGGYGGTEVIENVTENNYYDNSNNGGGGNDGFVDNSYDDSSFDGGGFDDDSSNWS